jgi:HK97 family phage major capsid protein
MSTKQAILAQLEALQSGPMGRKEQVRSSILLAQLANIRTDEQAESRAAKADAAFCAYLRSGNMGEYRSEMDSSNSGAFVSPIWAGNYQARLKSSSGLRQAGAVVKTYAKGGNPIAAAFADDTSTSAVRITPGTQITDVIATASVNKPNLFLYAAKGCRVSLELVQDIGFSLNDFLAELFSQRVARTTTNEFTNGASGGPDGVLPAITNTVSSSSSSVPSLSELVAVQTAIDPAYRSEDAQPVYMMSPTMEGLLKAAVASGSGERMYPEMSEGKLLGYDYVLNVSMPSSAGSVGVVYGSVKKAVTIHDVVPTVIVSFERFGDSAEAYYSLLHKQGVVVNDPNGLAAIQLHA